MTLPIPNSNNFRNEGDQISPTWLNGPVAQKYRYSMNVIFDALADAASYAVLARFPQRAPDDAFSWIASDRQIDRGLSEPKETFITRLLLWLDLWRIAGNAKSMLLAMLSNVSPNLIRVRQVSDSSVWDTFEVGTDPLALPDPVHLRVTPTNWRWDSLLDPYRTGISWWRVWVILYASSIWNQGKNWGSFTWGDGTCWGFSGTAQEAQSITNLAKKWRAGHAWVVFVILAWDNTMFDPSLAFGSAKLPDGKWGHWGKVTSSGGFPRVYVQARSTSASYLQGDPS